MEAKELRVGNRILFDGKITIVNTRMLAYINNANRLKNKIDLISFEPILLTEEILLKCNGMFKSENQLSIDRFVLSFQPKYNFWYVLDSISLTYISKIEFLHEWLNLYFFLNGEELEINL